MRTRHTFADNLAGIHHQWQKREASKYPKPVAPANQTQANERRYNRAYVYQWLRLPGDSA